MSATVFAFPSRGKGPQPWTNEELAELYRVVDLLGRAGLPVITDMGLSDEGDPWFVFCRADNGEVIAHFARIDGHFVAASIAVDETFRGANFRQIVERMVSSQPLVVPPPGGGSRLLLHPAVLLTAFVATALAHSEKMRALDLLRSVEAQWEHAKASAANEIRHLKTGWLDTLQSLLKLPLHEGKVGHDSAKEGQALTLASLIAIAMATLQPIVEKMSSVAQIVADELPGHVGGAGHAQGGHAAPAAQDGPALDLSSAAQGQPATHTQDGSGDSPQAHKMAGLSADAAGETQKVVIDTAHLASIAALQKAAPAEDSSHSAAAPAETPGDIGAAFAVIQQKAAIAAQQPIESVIVVHFDSSGLAQAISVQDVTPQALQLLNINVSKSDGQSGDASKPASGDVSPAQPSQPSHSGDTGTGISVAAPTPTPAGPSTTHADSGPSDGSAGGTTVVPVDSSTPPQVTAPEVIDTSLVSGGTVIRAISDFVSSGAHTIQQQSSITVGAALQNELAGYFGANSSLKVIFFDSTTAISDVFAFSSGVVLVNERDISPTAHFTNTGGSLLLEVPGGSVTLVGVATIEHATATATI